MGGPAFAAQPRVLVPFPSPSRFSALAARHGKTIRLATKSVRVPALIRRILDVGAPAFQGLMCFSTAEARYLGVDEGHDDIMVAYPCAVHDLADIWALAVDHGKRVQVCVRRMRRDHALRAHARRPVSLLTIGVRHVRTARP